MAYHEIIQNSGRHQFMAEHAPKILAAFISNSSKLSLKIQRGGGEFNYLKRRYTNIAADPSSGLSETEMAWITRSVEMASVMYDAIVDFREPISDIEKAAFFSGDFAEFMEDIIDNEHF